MEKVVSSSSHPHGCEHDGEVVLAVVHHVLRLLHQTGLPTDLSCDLTRRTTRTSNLKGFYFEIWQMKACVCVCVCVCASLCGSPAAEKMGIFCPLAMLFMPSMAEIPVWIISSG